MCLQKKCIGMFIQYVLPIVQALFNSGLIMMCACGRNLKLTPDYETDRRPENSKYTTCPKK